MNGNIGSPVSNDGYKVTAMAAKMMAAVARGYLSVQRFVNKEWEEVPVEERDTLMKTHFDGNKVYRGSVHESRLEWLDKFVEFAENSKGFTIK